MLKSIRVRDLATVEDVTLELGPGLNVLTGETGAGKSIVVDALALLLGDRADRAAVRPGSSRLVVEGEFVELTAAVAAALDSAGLDPEGDVLVVRREVTREGRSRAWVNGSPTTIGVLATIGAMLVDLHGQHQTAALVDRSTQRRLLDAYAVTGELVAAVSEAHGAVLEAHKRLNELRDRRDQALKRADWLRHVVEEIEHAAPKLGEEEEIAREANRLAQAGTLGEQSRRISTLIDAEPGGIRGSLGELSRAIDLLARHDDTTLSWRELLDSTWAGLDELSRRVAEYTDDVAEDPDRLSALERRRETIARLVRKHGPTVEDVLRVGREAAAELELINSADLDLQQLGTLATEADAESQRCAGLLSTARSAAAGQLAGEVTRLLPGLSLLGASFEVVLVPREEIGPDGAESIEFRARLNPGMAPKAIAGVASGGELSRLMLALKVAVARHDQAATLVFDEIDQGIGGETGTAVGSALGRVSGRHQVLVITHLPQIAGMADRHLLILKANRRGLATSDLSVLHGEDRMIELARMLGDPDDPDARRLALSLMRSAVSG